MRKKPLKRDNRTFNRTIGNWFKGGGFTISSPTSWHYNGSNYYLGFERYTETQPSKMWIIKQTDNNIEYNNVNTGTSNPDNLDHTTPLWGGVSSTGYLYTMQCDGWGQPIRVYKSSTPETITGTWTYVGDFDTNASYIWQVQGDDINDMWFVTRSTTGALTYSLALLNVDLDNPTAYVKLQISDSNFATDQIRHYAQCAYFTGTSTYRTLFINHRVESTSVNYKNSIMLHKRGTDEIYTFDLGSFKDVGVSGELTNTELEADYKFQGTDSDKTVYNIILASKQIDDDVYIINQTELGIDMYKMTIGSLTPVATQALVWWGVYYMYDRGDKLLLYGYDSTFAGDMAVWTIEYDLTGLTLIKRTNGLPKVGDFGVPYNYGDIVGKHLLIGAAVSGDDGNVPMILNNETI
jgi:hypothetical protein